MALYSEKVMDHFRNPRNVGVIEDANGIGEVGNAKCGDIMKMYLKIEDGVVQDVKFETFGCGSAIASSSMATELIKGQMGFIYDDPAVFSSVLRQKPFIVAQPNSKAAVCVKHIVSRIDKTEIKGTGGFSGFFRKMMGKN